MSTDKDGFKIGYNLTTWYVQDRYGNIQGGHDSQADAMKHANMFNGLRAYESVTVVRQLPHTKES